MKLTASEADIEARFGRSVAVSGDTAIVGAVSDDFGGSLSSAGAAYVFQRNEGGSNNWGEVKKITASDVASYDFFGSNVAIDGVTVTVAAIRSLLGET